MRPNRSLHLFVGVVGLLALLATTSIVDDGYRLLAASVDHLSARGAPPAGATTPAGWGVAVFCVLVVAGGFAILARLADLVWNLIWQPPVAPDTPAAAWLRGSGLIRGVFCLLFLPGIAVATFLGALPGPLRLVAAIFAWFAVVAASWPTEQGTSA